MRRPTDEQLERLARIQETDQRRILLEAIQRGQDIPEYAWQPIDMNLLGDPSVVSLHNELVEYAWKNDRDLSEVIASMDPRTLVQHFAKRATLTATKESDVLCSPPFVVPPHLEELQFCTGLLVWGIFNPYGPTLGGLALVDVPDNEESLIYYVSLNPFVRQDTVYGVVPTKLGPQNWEIVLRELFRRHATGPHALMPECLPSFLIPLYVGEEWDHAAPTICDALTHIGLEEIGQFCRDATMCRNDPWGVASLERDRAYAEILTGQSAVNGPKTKPEIKANPEQLQPWWRIVSQKEHALAYAKELPVAWEGAIKNEASHPKVIEVEELISVWNTLCGVSGESQD